MSVISFNEGAHIGPDPAKKKGRKGKVTGAGEG